MKTQLLIFIFCILNLTSSEIIGEYLIESRHSGDTLELKKDGTYEYKLRGSSCWLWSDFSGTWNLKNDKLRLFHNHRINQERIEYIEKIDKESKDFINALLDKYYKNEIA